MNVQRIQPHLGPLFAEGHFSRMHLLSSSTVTSCSRGNREARSSQELQANRVDFRRGKGNQIRAVNALDVRVCGAYDGLQKLRKRLWTHKHSLVRGAGRARRRLEQDRNLNRQPFLA